MAGGWGNYELKYGDKGFYGKAEGVGGKFQVGYGEMGESEMKGNSDLSKIFNENTALYISIIIVCVICVISFLFGVFALCCCRGIYRGKVNRGFVNSRHLMQFGMAGPQSVNTTGPFPAQPSQNVPQVMQHNQPQVMQHNQPQVMQHNPPEVMQHNPPKDMQHQEPPPYEMPAHE